MQYIKNRFTGTPRNWDEVTRINNILISDQIVTNGSSAFLAKGDDNKYYLDRDVVEGGGINIKKFFGAKGDGIADDAPALNAAFSVCGDLNIPLIIPFGQYRINSPIIWNKPVQVIGLSKGGNYGGYRTVINAGAAMDAMIKAGDNIVSDRDKTLRSFFEGVNLDGKNLANYGFYGITSHSTFQHLRISGTKLAALCVGYGWNNTFFNLELSFNYGDGLDIESVGGGQANNSLISGCKCFVNEGVGAKIGQGYGIAVVGSHFEHNKVCGVFALNNLKGFTIIGCYFESNCELGYDFTSPTSYNVKSDIILNGAGNYETISDATPCYGGIRDNFVSASYSTSFIFGNGLRSGAISGNVCHNVSIGLLNLFGNANGASYSLSYGTPYALEIGANFGFSYKIDMSPIASGVLLAGDRFRDYIILGSDNRNIIEQNLAKWTVISGGAGGAWQKSTMFFKGLDVYEIASVANENTHTVGTSINASDYPEMQSKMMIMGAWVRDSFTNTGGVSTFAMGAFTSSSFTNTPNVWRFVSHVFKMPASGTISFGFRKVGASGNIHISAPIMCELGSDINALVGQSKNVSRERVSLTVPTPTAPSSSYVQAELVSTNTRLADLEAKLKSTGLIS